MDISDNAMARKRIDASFWLWHGLLPLLLFVLLAALFELTDLDLLLSDSWYDPAAGWVYKRSWWAEGVIHQGGKNLVLAAALAALAAWGFSFRLSRLRPWRRPALFLLLSIGLGTGSVALGKATINRHCPWDYDRYGGVVPYVRLFEPVPAGHKPGHGFPAGHASGALSLTGGYFIFYGRNRRRALAVLSTGLLLGAAFGFGQLVRGAHFVSHNLWSAAICWLVALLLYVFVFRGRLHPEPAPLTEGDLPR